jgi:hypothetical protein
MSARASARERALVPDGAVPPDGAAAPGAPPRASGEAAGPAHRNLGLALVVIATAQLMVVLDATIVNVALPAA